MAAHAFSPVELLGIAPRRQMTEPRRIASPAIAGIEAVLIKARRSGRRAITIVDNKCGDGRLLIRAAKRASALGFIVIGAHGFDRSPECIRRARSAARFCRDPNIRLGFNLRQDAEPLLLDDEADLMLADPDEDSPSALHEITWSGGAVIDRRGER